MIKILMIVFGVGVLLFVGSERGNATLLTIGTATYNGSDYKLIWDDDNYGKSVVWLDYTNSYDTWYNMTAWAAGLSSNLTINILPEFKVNWGVDPWRLPATWVETGTGTRTSEMEHLYNSEWMFHPITNHDYGDFENIINHWYWSGTDYTYPDNTTNPANGSMYHMLFGMHGGNWKMINEAAMAIRTIESVTPTPEPATMFLLGTGLVGVAGVARKRKKK